MISAVGKQKKIYDTSPTQTAREQRREQPLQIDAAAAREIYKIIEPHLWLRKLGNDQNLIFAEDRKARISHQVKRKDDDGIWRDNGKA